MKSFPYVCYFSFLLMIKVFEDVVEILDPEMNIDSEIGEDEMQVEVVNSYLNIKCNLVQLNVIHQCDVTVITYIITWLAL